MTRWLVSVGVILIVAGLIWPWFVRLGLVRLPGDIVIERENFRFYFPIREINLVRNPRHTAAG